jgi:membrane-bound lytic murein transglycosylase A
MRLLFLFAFLLSISAQSETLVTPTEKVVHAEWPNFTDDLEFVGLAKAIDRQINHFKKMDLSGQIEFGNDRFPLTQVRDSLIQFKTLIGEYTKCRKTKTLPADCLKSLNTQIEARFNLYRPLLSKGDPRFGEPKATFFTGYYTPLMTVSLAPTAEFSHPIYAAPKNEKLRRSTRIEIDFKGALRGQGLELYYAKNLFDVYLMHVEGGGHLLVKDGEQTTSQYIWYDTSNGRRFQFIVNYMLAKKWIQGSSVQEQREFLNAHPELQEEIYATCPSYVFYRPSLISPAGSGGVPLTENRSMATDKNLYAFKGVLGFVSTVRPTESSRLSDKVSYRDFSRFFIDQDTGSAIRGKARVDLYFGEGDYAEYASANEAVRGDLYFLMLKP